MDWVAAEDALAELSVRKQTLYSYVSRGLVRAKADDADPRRSLYSASDISRLKGRRRGARRRSEVAAGAIAWGEPVLESAISTVRDGQLIVRGKVIEALAAKSSLEDMACLLWNADQVPPQGVMRRTAGSTPKARAFAMLARRANDDAPSLGRNPAALRADAWSILQECSIALSGQDTGLIHQRLARAWKLDAQGANIIRRALVLMADHELNASTFAVRIAASTGAPLAACALAGLSTLAGPLHGEAPTLALAQLDRLVAAKDTVAEARAMIARGEDVAGWSHPLYPEGDVRAANLLAGLAKSRRTTLARFLYGLGIRHVGDTLVGSESLRGISGGAPGRPGKAGKAGATAPPRTRARRGAPPTPRPCSTSRPSRG